MKDVCQWIIDIQFFITHHSRQDKCYNDVQDRTNDDGIEHKFELSEDRNYLIIAQREYYFPDTIRFSTIGAEVSDSIVKKMYLSTDMMLLDVYTFTMVGKLPLEGTTVTLIDMSDSSVKEMVELNPLSNEFNFMLDRGKQYKIIARKEGYTDAVAFIDTRPYEKYGLSR